jgi:hypothetical protein
LFCEVGAAGLGDGTDAEQAQEEPEQHRIPAQHGRELIQQTPTKTKRRALSETLLNAILLFRKCRANGRGR